MAKTNENYHSIEVESYRESQTGGLHGAVHIRPTKGGIYPQDVRVECPREMRDTSRFPLGTVFRVRAKLTDRQGGGSFLYSHHSWAYEVVRTG